MAIVGFNFTKIQAERKKPIKGKFEIKTKVAIKDVKKSDVSIDKTRSAAKIDFDYTTSYEPGVGKITIGGNLTYVEDNKTVKEMLDNWEKEKKPKGENMNSIIKHIMVKCNVQAVVTSRDVNLPAPMHMKSSSK